MVKYHINPETGNPLICRASVRDCPVGGDHFESKDEARQAYEATMDSATSGLKSIQKEISEKREDKAAALLEGFPTYLVSKSSNSIIEKVLTGKKVPDEKIDLLLASERKLTIDDGYNRPEQIEAVKRVFDAIKEVRDKRGTPSTLKNLQDFDPSKETLFSNSQARKNPFIAGRAIRKEAAHAEWMHELAEQESELLEHVLKDPQPNDNPDQLRNRIEQCKLEAKESEARTYAQLKEIQYLFNNDEEFRANSDNEINSILSSGEFRVGETYKDTWIGPVKKIK